MQYSAALRFLQPYLPSRLLAVTLLSILLNLPVIGWAQCGTCNRTINSNANDITIGSNETVCIAAGVVFTRNINWNGSGSTLCNSGTITSSFNINSTGNTFINNGTFDARSFSVNSGTRFINAQGARVTLEDLSLNGGGIVNNSGTIDINPGNNRTLPLSGTITNAVGATFTITASVNFNSGGQLNNLGTFTVSDINNNATIITCGTFRQSVAGGTFRNDGNGLVSNYGLFDIIGNFVNNGVFDGATQGGVGILRVARNSVQNGGGSFAPTGRLNFCRGFDRDNGTTNAANVTCSTSQATAGCANSPLPVELTSFEAKLSKGSVLLTWTTASEKDNEKFVVERSANGESFEAFTEVAGHGTSSSGFSYSATDLAPLPGTSYYRLRQTDFDGTTAYSPVITIQHASTNATNKLGVYPNPATDYITLDLPKGVKETYEVRISTVNGKLVRRLNLSGSNPQLDLHALPAGTYLLEVRGANTQTVQRLIKQ